MSENTPTPATPATAATAATASCCTTGPAGTAGEAARAVPGEGGCCSGAAAGARPVTAAFQVSGMTCGHCAGAVTAQLEALAEVRSVQADPAGGLVRITTDGEPDEARLAAAVTAAGYELTRRVPEETR